MDGEEAESRTASLLLLSLPLCMIVNERVLFLGRALLDTHLSLFSSSLHAP